MSIQKEKSKDEENYDWLKVVEKEESEQNTATKRWTTIERIS